MDDMVCVLDEEVPDDEPDVEPLSNKRGNLIRFLILAGLAATITIFRIKTHKKRS